MWSKHGFLFIAWYYNSSMVASHLIELTHKEWQEEAKRGKKEDLPIRICLFISVSPLMYSYIGQGNFPDFCQVHAGTHSSPTAPWKGLESKHALCVYVCLCVCVCDWKDWRGTSISYRFLVFSGLNSPHSLTHWVFRNSHKVRQEEKSYNSNCHQ